MKTKLIQKIKEDIHKTLLKYEERETVDDGYNLEEVYCEVDEDLLREILEVVEKAISQSKEELVKKIRSKFKLRKIEKDSEYYSVGEPFRAFEDRRNRAKEHNKMIKKLESILFLLQKDKENK